MGDVIDFTGITKLDIPADKVLERAIGKFDGVVVLGFDKEGNEYFASSYADGGTINWLLDRCKARLMENADK